MRCKGRHFILTDKHLPLFYAKQGGSKGENICLSPRFVLPLPSCLNNYLTWNHSSNSILTCASSSPF